MILSSTIGLVLGKRDNFPDYTEIVPLAEHDAAVKNTPAKVQ